MTFTKLQRDWFTAVAKWRAAKPKTRFVAAVDSQATSARYYFTIDRFVHRIEAETLSQMEIVKPGPSFCEADYSDVT